MTAPQRIQRRRAKGWRMPPNTVCVSRPGRLGNPYEIHREGRRWIVKSQGAIQGAFDSEADARKTAVEFYRYSMGWNGLLMAKKQIGGQNLACWCRLPPAGIADRDWCHAGWLCEAVNS